MWYGYNVVLADLYHTGTITLLANVVWEMSLKGLSPLMDHFNTTPNIDSFLNSLNQYDGPIPQTNKILLP
jgi:hypothetical protein